MEQYQIVCLFYFIGRFLKPTLGGVDTPIAFIDILLYVAHVIVLEPPFRLFVCRSSFVLRLQALAVDFRTRAQILFCVGELIMGARADEV